MGSRGFAGICRCGLWAGSVGARQLLKRTGRRALSGAGNYDTLIAVGQ